MVGTMSVWRPLSTEVTSPIQKLSPSLFFAGRRPDRARLQSASSAWGGLAKCTYRNIRKPYGGQGAQLRARCNSEMAARGACPWRREAPVRGLYPPYRLAGKHIQKSGG